MADFDFDDQFSSLKTSKLLALTSLQNETRAATRLSLHTRHRPGYNKYMHGATTPIPVSRLGTLVTYDYEEMKKLVRGGKKVSVLRGKVEKERKFLGLVKPKHDAVKINHDDYHDTTAISNTLPSAKRTIVSTPQTPPPLDALTSELLCIKWIILRETYLTKLTSLPPPTDTDTNTNTYDTLLKMLRSITMSLIKSITTWRLTVNSDAPFEWGGTNYLLKIAHDTTFLSRLKFLEEYLNLDLRFNPLVYSKHVDGKSASLNNNTGKKKDALPKCMRGLNTKEIEECYGVVLREMEMEGDDYREQGYGDFAGVDCDEYVPTKVFSATITSSFGYNVPSSTLPTTTTTTTTSKPLNSTFNGYSLSHSNPSQSPLPSPSPSPFSPPRSNTGIRKNNEALERELTFANETITQLLKDKENTEHNLARSGLLGICWLGWRSYVDASKRVKRHSERRKRNTLKDCFFFWNQFAHRALHVQRIAAWALAKKKGLLRIIPISVMLKEHFDAWTGYRIGVSRVEAFRKKYGAKFVGVCLGAWMYFTRIGFGIRKIKKELADNLMIDVFSKWKKVVVLRTYTLGGRFKARHKMRMGEMKGVRNAWRLWLFFLDLKKRVVKIDKIVRRVRRMHAFNIWLVNITTNNANAVSNMRRRFFNTSKLKTLRITKSMGNLGSLFSHTPFKKRVVMVNTANGNGNSNGSSSRSSGEGGAKKPPAHSVSAPIKMIEEDEEEGSGEGEEEVEEEDESLAEVLYTTPIPTPTPTPSIVKLPVMNSIALKGDQDRRDVNSSNRRLSTSSSSSLASEKDETKLSSTDSTGNDSLLYAASSSNASLLHTLSKKGWDLTVVNNKAQNILHLACSSEHSNSLPAIQFILELNEEENLDLVNAIDSLGYTPLIHSAISGYRESCLLLLEHGSNLNHVESASGKNALHFAVMNSRRSACQCLLDAGIDYEYKDSKGCTAMHFAASIGAVQIGTMLFNSGAYLDSVDLLGKTPLHNSVINDRMNFSDMLLTNGCNPDTVDEKTGKSALHHSVENSNREIIELLGKHIADFNCVDVEGNTPLHVSALKNCGKFVIRMLLRYGADANIGNESGLTASEVAFGLGFDSCGDCIVSAGAGGESGSEDSHVTSMYSLNDDDNDLFGAKAGFVEKNVPKLVFDGKEGQMVGIEKERERERERDKNRPMF